MVIELTNGLHCSCKKYNVGILTITISKRETMRVDEITTWEAFVGVAKQGNFSKAAKSLALTPSQLSKRIARLEDRLGVRLFQRSTRVVSLTNEGRALFPKVNSILEDLSGVESFFQEHQKLSGTVRVTCVTFVAHRLLLPVLKDFMAMYPDIEIQLDLSEKFVNLIESGFDMAIRIETPKDSELIYRKLAPNDLIFCVSPEYLRRNKTPLTKPADLLQHDLLMLSIHNRCKFKDSPSQLSAFEAAKKIRCEDGVFLTEMALQGFGVLVRSIWDVQDHLKNGRLVQVLANHPIETFGFIHAVIPSARYLAPRVRAFLDFVIKQSVSWN
jgi:DNA-binding transcriptional LysR family regulator